MVWVQGETCFFQTCYRQSLDPTHTGQGPPRSRASKGSRGPPPPSSPVPELDVTRDNFKPWSLF